MNRKRLALLALVVAIFLSGCGVFGGGEIDDDDLLEEQEYNWESNATATFDLDVSSSAYAAVVDVEGQSELEIHRESWIRGDRSVSIEALQFRFENGTVVNATHSGLTAIEGSDETTIELPAENGSVGYTAPRSGKSWSAPASVDGQHRLDLPESTRVGIPLLSQTSPSPDDRELEDDQMSIYWDDIERGDTISVRYYLVRDLWLFGGLFAIAVSLGVGGVTYYYKQIRRAKKKREEVGLDIDMDDDDVGDDGPPPGMR